MSNSQWRVRASFMAAIAVSMLVVGCGGASTATVTAPITVAPTAASSTPLQTQTTTRPIPTSTSSGSQKVTTDNGYELDLPEDFRSVPGSTYPDPRGTTTCAIFSRSTWGAALEICEQTLTIADIPPTDEKNWIRTVNVDKLTNPTIFQPPAAMTVAGIDGFYGVIDGTYKGSDYRIAQFSGVNRGAKTILVVYYLSAKADPDYSHYMKDIVLPSLRKA